MIHKLLTDECHVSWGGRAERLESCHFFLVKNRFRICIHGPSAQQVPIAFLAMRHGAVCFGAPLLPIPGSMATIGPILHGAYGHPTIRPWRSGLVITLGQYQKTQCRNMLMSRRTLLQVVTEREISSSTNLLGNVGMNTSHNLKILFNVHIVVS